MFLKCTNFEISKDLIWLNTAVTERNFVPWKTIYSPSPRWLTGIILRVLDIQGRQFCYWLMDAWCVPLWQGLLVRVMPAVSRPPLAPDWLHVLLCGMCCLGLFVIVKNRGKCVTPAGRRVNTSATHQRNICCLLSAEIHLNWQGNDLRRDKYTNENIWIVLS